MGGVPLHPLVVHLPLVLAAFLPVILIALLWADWRGISGARAWWLGALVSALLAAGAFVSLKTGENEEERVEEVVPEAALETHEERAELFLWATVAPLVLLLGAAVTGAERPRRWIGLGAVVASLVVGGMAVGVGHSGGTLVYVHHAGAAYGDGGGARPAAGVERVEH